MTNKKVNPADILISPLGMEKFLVINQANDEVIKNNELLLDKPYFSLEDVLDGLNKDGHYLIIVEVRYTVKFIDITIMVDKKCI